MAVGAASVLSPLYYFAEVAPANIRGRIDHGAAGDDHHRPDRWRSW
jgi:hypothetical protein